jgi:hypothetical protein
MNKLSLLTAALGLLSFAEVSAQDVMHYGLKHLKVLAEDEKVRVLKYSPERGSKTPGRSHADGSKKERRASGCWLAMLIYLLQHGTARRDANGPPDRSASFVTLAARCGSACVPGIASPPVT